MFHLIEPDLGYTSGGLHYNHEVCVAADGQLRRHQLPGAWPQPTADDVAALHALVEQADGPVLLDGLIGCSLEATLEAPVPVVQLVHALAQGKSAQHRQRINLQAADAVVATSRYSSSELFRRHGITAVVARPGIASRAVATGCGGRHIICVGGLEPNKNQMFLLDVLHNLQEQGVTDWHCTLAGPHTDTDYVCQVLARRRDMGPERIQVTGELDADGLAKLYDRADLLVLPSKVETFGLVVQEAAAAGIPAFVSADTGAQEALVTGRAMPLDVTVWATELQRWLTDIEYRRTIRNAAHRARTQLTYGWQPTARIILDVLATLDG